MKIVTKTSNNAKIVAYGGVSFPIKGKVIMNLGGNKIAVSSW